MRKKTLTRETEWNEKIRKTCQNERKFFFFLSKYRVNSINKFREIFFSHKIYRTHPMFIMRDFHTNSV